MAGATDVGVFTHAALGRIAQHAEGIPRIVNTLCDHSLLIGYADQTRRIDGPIVEEAIAYLQAGRRARRRRARVAARSWSAVQWGVLGISAGVVAGGVTWLVLPSEIVSQAAAVTTAYAADVVHTVRTLLER